MTAAEHIKRAEQLLKLGENQNYGHEQTKAAVACSQAHSALALAKLAQQATEEDADDR